MIVYSEMHMERNAWRDGDESFEQVVMKKKG